jgi:hypothetical protein
VNLLLLNSEITIQFYFYKPKEVVALASGEEQRKTMPPRTRLLSNPRTLPEFDAVRTEKVARNVITKLRIPMRVRMGVL